MRTMYREVFIRIGINAVLSSLDSYMKHICDSYNCVGWKDKDLQNLLPALEKHFNTLADRYSDPNSKEVGSANFPKLI